MSMSTAVLLFMSSPSPLEAAPYIATNLRLDITRTHSQDLLVGRAMPLWDTVMIALAIGSTILFCFFGPLETTARSISAAKLLTKDETRSNRGAYRQAP